MLFLPHNTESKLLAKWQGPYAEVWRIGPFHYDVLCPDKQEREKESSCQLAESVVGTGSGLDHPDGGDMELIRQVQEMAGPKDVVLPDDQERQHCWEGSSPFCWGGHRK